jgi:hypothetical protein
MRPILATIRSTLSVSPKATLLWITSHRWHTVGLVSLALTLVLVTVAGTLAWHTYQVAERLQLQARDAARQGQSAYDLFKAQDLPASRAALQKLQTQLQEMDLTYHQLSWYGHVPYAVAYFRDGEAGLTAAAHGLAAAERALVTLEPYADVLGFAGEGSFEGGTAEDRLTLLLQTIDKVFPELDAITADVEQMQQHLNSIDPERYPEHFRGYEIQSNIIKAQEMSAAAVAGLVEYRPALQQLPAVAGAGGERKKYLILFQNDNELRPTGGFLTAYAIITVEDGKVTPEKSDDIYELDKKFTKRLPIPEQLGRYLTTERYWNLRDMNISPDFKTSIETFFEYYQGVPGEPDDIDGIIAVDTEFLTNLLTILGPVEVPGYGTFSAETDPRCDCPQIIYVLSEIITRPTPYIREDRKGILGPLMRAILTKAYGAPRQQWPELVALTERSVGGRHLQMYFLDPEAQAAAEVVGAAGLMSPPAVGESDFLGIVNSNLGGAKSNLFVEYSAKKSVSQPENGRITNTLEISYRNTRRADNCNLEAGLLCLNSTLRDWTRLYLPEGAELIEAQGFTESPRTYDEAGFTVIDGFFILEPLGSATVRVTYSVPYSDSETYRTTVWKQGGIESYDLLLDVTGGQELLSITRDATYETTF